ncbi:MAG: hypothetical protein AAF183_24255 [Pseudomonadota bacterium]
MPINLETQRFSTADFANRAIRRQAGLYKRRDAHIGPDEAVRPHFDGSWAAILLDGGARSLKGSIVFPWLVDGCLGEGNGSHHIFALDFKRQDTVVDCLC